MTIAEAIDESVRSTDFFDPIAYLARCAEEEKRRRRQFYKDLDADTKAGFLNGEVAIHPPVRLAHSETSIRVTVLLHLHATLHDLGALHTGKCLVHCERNDSEPDICFFQKARRAALAENQMIFPPPDLAAEILPPSTAGNDCTLKSHDYARHGVVGDWIIDADARAVEPYSLPPGAGEYELSARASGRERLSSTAVAGCNVPVGAFFNAKASQQALRDLSGRS